MRKMKDSGIEWIGEIPESWDICKLKYAAECRTEKTANKSSSVPYIGLEHVKSDFGTLVDEYSHILDFEGDTIEFKAGDVLFGKLRPYLAKAWSASFNGKCSSEFWVMSPIKLTNRFLLYTVLSNHFIANIDHSTFGVKMPRAEWEYAGNQLVCCPSISEQENISNYLDQKCAEIDAIIAAKEKTNELLKERRQSIIYEAVTKGLDPTVPMKDSGVEWIGMIPESWSVVALKRVAKPSTGMTPNKANPEYWDGDIPWFSSKDIKDFYLTDSEDHITEKAIEDCGLTLYDANSVVFCARSGILRHTFPVAVMKCQGTINQDLRVLTTANSVDPDFLMYYLRGMNNTIVTLYQKIGATVESIETDWLLYLPTVLPPIEEQRTIAKGITARCDEINNLITTNNTSIQKLKEYRQSVIYEAVTGKVEI